MFLLYLLKVTTSPKITSQTLFTGTLIYDKSKQNTCKAKRHWVIHTYRLQHYFLQLSVRSSARDLCFVFIVLNKILIIVYSYLICHLVFISPLATIYPLCFSVIIHYKRWVLYTCQKTPVTLPNQRISDLLAGPGVFLAHYSYLAELLLTSSLNHTQMWLHFQPDPESPSPSGRQQRGSN